MSDGLRYEWTRLSTLRSTWWISGLAVVIGTAVSVLIAAVSANEVGSGVSGEDLSVIPQLVASNGAAVGVPFVVAFLVAMIGIFAWGHEYRYAMVRTTLTAVPSRTTEWIAKYVVVGAWVAGVWVLTTALSMLLGSLFLSGTGISVLGAVGLGMAGRCLAYVVLLTWLAMSFTAIVRNQVAALVLLFLWPFVLENVVTVLVNVIPGVRGAIGPAARFLPFNAGTRTYSVIDFSLSGDALGPGVGVAVFAGYTVVLLVASLVLFQRRDA